MPAQNAWRPLAYQNPIDPDTDYFVGAELAAKWTEWDPGSKLTVTQDGRLILTQASTAGHGLAGVVQPAPAYTRYAVTAWLAGSVQWNLNTTYWGVLVGEDLIANPGTDGLLTFGPKVHGALEVNAEDWTDYANNNSTVIAIADVEIAPKLFRIFVDTVAEPTEYTVLWSHDGISWLRSVAFGTAKISGDPAAIGIMVNNATAGAAADIVATSLMFRVDETTDPSLPCGALA